MRRRIERLLPLWGLILALLLPVALQAQRGARGGLAYYALGPLYDTLPSPYGADADYLNTGPLRWNGARYRAAVERYAALLDSMALPVVALYGVENERVALDLAARSSMEYAVLHRTSNAFDGLDFALLYQADQLFPHRAEVGYGTLCVEAEWLGREVLFLLVEDDRFLAEKLEELQQRYPDRPLLVLGCGADVASRAGLRSAHAEAERQGRGTRLRRGVWQMRDAICYSSHFRPIRADVYARFWLFDSTQRAPLPLYDKLTYLGGYGQNLPLFAYFELGNLED